MWNLRGSRSPNAIFAVYKTMAGGGEQRGRTLQSVGGQCVSAALAHRSKCVKGTRRVGAVLLAVLNFGEREVYAC